ncbi:flagellar biosynthesis protein FlhF [Alicyclobacillus cycloheptanicus]|uniref:Flagellar biosynthesis protein FlhF n=1 Tax=Alicyclobacillus cycloheptanicus TaxID=1457 RepID=A0ABT9XJQ2_9BACL|nr:flagellar biosynthesis protein FlhF [Alicyclobacillus cycloheptanicus]MDQ0190540.1 flagellar biosynthesis protein FlhF [Alicyclobacillus cycloheptanicus]WDM01383.1 flagellar biosynthesis protein FlhF [Alicyclobacillus cycloheptanicus]
MMVRRYVVKQMPEAVALIRRDLGRDAVILSTRDVFVKRWLGLWRMRRLEVLAAAGEEVTAGRPRTLTSAEAARAAERLPAPLAQAPAAGQLAPAAPGSAVQMESAAMAGSRVDVLDLRSELASLREMVSQTLVPQGASTALLQRMIAAGIDEGRAIQLLAAAHADLADRPEAGDAAAQAALLARRVRDGMMTRLYLHCDPEPIRSSSRLAAFLGPTGVGKTTTVAKLAAQYVLNGERKIGLITTDTFRVAAIDQLRTYANILQVPLETVYEPADLPEAVQRLADCDLILMDTAGRNFQMDVYVEEMTKWLSAAQVDETFLVLSMTTKSSDLEQIVRSFASLHVDKLLFTKMDETTSYGSVLNLLLKHPKPLSYITTGQNVPDDIEVASIERLVNSVVGADHNA